MRQTSPTGRITVASISKFRQEIMGVAILGILLFHGHAVLYGGITGYLFAGIKLFMQIGVDIFFLLSGFGCFHSLKNSNAIMKPLSAALVFYSKRLRRILPKYLLAVAIYCFIVRILFRELTLPEIVEHYSLVTFFTSGNLTEWFISAILMLYFFTPSLFLLVNANKRVFCWLIGLAAAVAYCISLLDVSYPLMIVNEIFFTRIPVFMTGLLLGKKCEEGLSSVSGKKMILVFVLFFSAYGMNRFVNSVNEIAVERLLFCPLAIAITFLLCSGFENRQIIGHKLFSFLGGITLELYLVHEKLLNIVQRLLYPESHNFVQMLIVDTVSILASVGTAVLIRRLFYINQKKTYYPSD